MSCRSRAAVISAIIYFLSCLPWLLSANHVDYAGYSVLEITPTTDADLFWLKSVKCKLLTELAGVLSPVQLLCSRIQTRALRLETREKNLGFKYVLKHFGEEVRKERKRIKRGKAGNGKHENYLDITNIYTRYDDLKVQFDNLVNIEIIGNTLEGRDIKIVKINSEDAELPAIFIDAGIHAREWISPASVMYFAEKLVRVLSKRKGAGSLGRFQWHIIPVANPDGYEYSMTKDRMWRKNRRINPGSECEGVDINRNFPKAYGVSSSTNPCHEDFRGTEAFSENEAAAMRDYLEKLQTQGLEIKAAISVHSYGNVLIFPWGYKEEPHPERARISKLAYKIVQAVRETDGEIYVPGTAYDIWGKWGFAGGCTDDWYMDFGIPYSFTWELPERDEEGFHGFLLPAKNIKRVGKQVYIGFKRMATYIFKEKKA